MRYSREDACRVWLSMVELNHEEFHRLMEHFGSAEGAYDETHRHGGKALAACGLSARACNVLVEGSDRAHMHRRLVKLQEKQIGLLYEEDEHYPEVYRHLTQPPWMLYYRGDLRCLLGRHLAIVGTRKSSSYGQANARSIAEELSRNGVSIVSGMAPGIDTAAHDGCMAGASPTIGLSGSGLEHPRPLGREGLDEEILTAGGLLLSEYPPESDAKPYHFPMRNRLISALGDGLLFVEGAIRSGGMLSVSAALDQGKDVFALPGPIGQEGAEGPLQILREGAILARNAGDILADMGWEGKTVSAPRTMAELPALTEDQRAVLKLLTVEELSFDQLTYQTGLDASRLNAALTLLELMGLVTQGSGRIYHKA